MPAATPNDTFFTPLLNPVHLSTATGICADSGPSFNLRHYYPGDYRVGDNLLLINQHDNTLPGPGLKITHGNDKLLVPSL